MDLDHARFVILTISAIIAFGSWLSFCIYCEVGTRRMKRLVKEAEEQNMKKEKKDDTT